MKHTCALLYQAALTLLLTSLGTAGAVAQATSATLDAITVVGESYVEYTPENTRSATRTDTPIKEIPQSISVISKDALEDMGETGIFSALEFGGVGRANVYAGGVNAYTLRGFRSGAYYRNGMAAGVGSGAIPDAVGIDSLDVMRGPSSLTFGSGDPGGAFNVVTKQPLDYAAYEAGLTLDTHGGRRGTADLTGPLNSAGTLSYRMNAAVSGGGTFRDHVRSHREYFAPRLSLQVLPQTKLLLDVEWVRADAPLDRGIPFTPNLLYGPPSRSFFHGDPNAGRVRNQNTVGQLRLEHAFSDNWHLDAGLQRTIGSITGYAVQLQSLQADGRTFTRELSGRENRWNSKLAQSYLRGKWMLAGMEHQILTGLEYSRTYQRTDNRRGPVGFPIDIYDPVYGVPMPVDQIAQPSTRPGTISHNRALVVQDQVRVTQALSVLAGLRHDRYQAVTNTRYANRVTTPRLGASYAFTDAMSGYVSYSQSFKPNNSQDANGSTFDPERGTAWELGVKTELFDQRLQVTTAIFHTVKTNVVTQDPLDPDVRILAGEVRSQGLDVSATGKIGARTRMMAYVGWIDAEITKDNNPVMPPGTRLQDVPMRRMSVMALHELGGALRGMEVGASVQYVGARATATNVTALRMPSYSTVNLMLNYQINHSAKLRLSVKNVFDRTYYEHSRSPAVFPGEPRALYATLEYKL